MEYRTWTTLSNLSVEAEETWLPLIGWLESAPGDLGAVISWVDEDTAQIVLSIDAASHSAAAAASVGVLVEALQAVGLSDRYPGAIEVELAGDLVAA
jgi:hypothetical protein